MYEDKSMEFLCCLRHLLFCPPNAVQYARSLPMALLGEKPGLITQEGTSYYVNGSEVEVV